MIGIIPILILLLIGATYLFLVMPRPSAGPDLAPILCDYAHRGLFDNAELPENSMGACARAVDKGVGIELNIQHTSATPVGLEVRAEAEVTAVDGKIITFSVKAFDEAGEIGNGTHKRAIVPVQKFLDKAYAKL